MARRDITKDTKSHYCRGDGSDSHSWDDGSVFTTGYVVSDYGIVAFNWWNGSTAARKPSAHDARLHWLSLEVVIDGTRFRRTVDTDKLSMLGIVRRARQFAREVWA